MRRQISWMVLLAVLFVLLGGFSFAVNLYFDYLWFLEVGKSVVFNTIIYAKSTLASLTLLSVFLFLYLNLWFANRGPGQIQIGIPTPTGQITAYTVQSQTVQRLSGLAAMFVGLFFAALAAARWETVWRWLHQATFNIKDPIFSRDLSFYFFSLPMFENVVSLGLILSLIAIAAVVALYYFKGVLTLRGLGNLQTGKRVSTHVSMLAALVFVLLAANAYLDRFQLLFGLHDVFSGANYADLHARIPLLNVLAVCALAGALLWIYNAFAANNRSAVAAVLLYFIVALAGNLYPAFLQKFIVAPNELDKEAPQIQRNIDATLQGYNMSQVQERNLSGDKALTPQDIEANATTIHSIRLWDHEPLLDTLKQIQEIRTYYDFATVDNDRYKINGELQQTMLSVRELNSNSLPERNWINEHLIYTHGYGLALGPVNRITSEGLPVLSVKDIPPLASNANLNIKRPEIYFGEMASGYAIVKTGQKEFDYPSGEANAFTTYEGTGGVPVGSFFRKLLLAYYFKDPNIVLSPLIGAESRFLYFRDLRTRFGRIAPFLLMDRDPYLVISEGRLLWMQDAYTVSNRYPYSTETRGVGNYIRNSAKLVLDAYNGTMEMYVADPSDPMIQVYQGIFPGAFKPISAMSQDLRQHLRYPEDIFRVQTYIYSVYHMSAPQVFYNKEDLWEIPVISGTGSENPMEPYYTIMRLPMESQEEFILMLPFTPGRKDNLSAWMVARSDGDHYGQLVVYRFPKQKLVYGPKQIVARINQDEEISRQISLWDQRGSEVIQGNLLVIPIEEALLYVRPLYLRAASGKIPELKRVIVAYENRIAMEETLEASLARIFQGSILPEASSGVAQPGGSAPSGTVRDTGNAALIRQAREAYDRATQAQRQGDWSVYGEELKKLGAILQDLNQQNQTGTEARQNQ